jgi:hypothetical protein
MILTIIHPGKNKIIHTIKINECQGFKREGRRDKEVELRGFLGQITTQNISRMDTWHLHICQNPQNVCPTWGHGSSSRVPAYRV